MGKGKKSINNKKEHSSHSVHEDGRDNDNRFDTSKLQFRKINPINAKITLDERFVSALSDPRFQLDLKDKHGKKKNKRTDLLNKSENLDSFYSVPETDNVNLHDKEDANEKPTKHRQQIDDESDNNNEDLEDIAGQDEKEIVKPVDDDPQVRINYLRALSRGELEMSSSSDEDNISDSGSDSDNDDHETSGKLALSDGGILDPSSKEEEDVELTTEPSPYLAVQNLEWTHIRAVDIFSIVSSFIPPGTVKHVRVFQSDFGMERMEMEKRFGPADLWKQTSADNSDKEDDNENPLDGIEESDEEDSDSEIPMAEQSRKKNSFDPEKLRAYEASKLKYYFAVVELVSPEYADVAYKEIDGLEFEHSSAVVDVRSIPPDSIESVVNGRPMRDEATSIPSNYNPPDFVVAALQKSTVECSWEAGDVEREKSLTKYTNRQSWDDIAEADDFKAFVGSDVSSDEEGSNSGNEKANKLRGILGLDNEEHDNNMNFGMQNEAASSDESIGSQDDQAKEMSYIPVDDSKSKSNEAPSMKELSPWEKYLEKKKNKRKEKRKSSREKQKEVSMLRKGKSNSAAIASSNTENQRVQTQEELELLVAGDDIEEEERNFDMRAIQKMEKKNPKKNLSSSRSQKLSENNETSVPESNFKINVSDDRFKRVFEGSDERFGIDRTDPNFKETTAMRDILDEQARRRKRRIQDTSNLDADKRTTTMIPETSGLSSVDNLVKRLKSKTLKRR